MKKILIVFAIISITLGIIPVANACWFWKKNKISEVKNSSVIQNAAEVIPVMSIESSASNVIWVGTFQIVWNEVMDNLVKGSVEFDTETPQMALDLNKREFNKTDISDNSYYTKYGTVSPKLKKEIIKGIKDKFDETSDILGGIDFSYNPYKLFFYAMLKKDFKFLEAFDKLEDEIFGSNPQKVEYFGINNNSNKKLYKNVTVLFYNSQDDFGVKLHTKTDDEVIFYRTNDDKTLAQYYTDLKEKTKKYKGSSSFTSHDSLKVPYINLYKITGFPDIEGKQIKGTNFKIDKTIETIDFKMNNEGVKLKSEAAIMMRTTALAPEDFIEYRYFYLTDNFVMFLEEKGKNVPYFAMKTGDVSELNKTGKQ